MLIQQAVYFSVHSEAAELCTGADYSRVNGAIFNKQSSPTVHNARFGSKWPLTHIEWAKTEISVFQKLVELFREYDPDVVVGYDAEGQSIGYICKRGEVLTIQLATMLSRVPVSLRPLNESYYNQRMMMRSEEPVAPASKQYSYFNAKWGQAVKINGRVVINLWKIIAHEVNLTNYDYDNVCFHLLKKREPRFDFDTLTLWWQKSQFSHVTNHVLGKLQGMFSILDTMNFIHRDINMANVYGIDYESVMTRGSQFRVEAILSKISKSQDTLLLSATPEQVHDQNQLEVIPLVIEPQKQFYTDPVVIVDFQSLYPSVIIAYNLCYSTCLGKIQTADLDRAFSSRKLGVTSIPASFKTFFGFPSDQQLSPEQERFIVENIIVAPNLNCFVKPNVKEGLLPKMLREILNTRIMVKKSMKLYAPGSTTYRMLDSRQLALKLIANVTYGYTAAGWSGRMPCVEVADSVVSIGRFTVEQAIGLINKQEQTEGTRVVYGDTDSLFILCQGRSVEQAFAIGEKIAKQITAINPFPMELKFEKVYYPCVTLAKKRYCGYKMEKLNETRVLDAKGIETIRRDTVEAVQKIEDKCLRILFETKSLTQVKSYLQRQWLKIIQGNVDFQDFIFAKEIRWGSYKDLPLGAIVIERKLQADPGAIPRFKERVPYVIVKGQGGAVDYNRLKDVVVSPEEFLAKDGMLLNANYYIKKQINAALNRIFLEIFDVDVNSWFDKLPKQMKEQGAQSKKIGYFSQQISSSKSAISQTMSKVSTSSIAGQSSMIIDTFYKRKTCAVCGHNQAVDDKRICRDCLLNLGQSAFILNSTLRNAELEVQKLNEVCLACSGMLLKGRVASMIDIEDTGNMSVVPCVSYQCRIFHQKSAAYKHLNYLRDVTSKLNFLH